MICPDIEELQELAKGEAPPARRSNLERHLERCASCHEHYRQVERQDSLISMLREHRDLVPEPEAPDDSGPSLVPPGYAFIEIVRHGGQAVIFKATEEETGRTVALKVLLSSGGDETSSARRRMERELEITGRLQHPNIVHLYTSGVIQERRFMVMEFIEGEHLDVYIERARPSVQERVHLLARITRAVHYAHQRGVIHRDLKPSNLLVDRRGDPHVLDFGIAKPRLPFGRLASDDDVTRTGEFAGTLPYASPEQLKGDPDLVDVRTDVHALGVLLYEALTGRHPYSDFNAIADLIDAIVRQPPPPLRRYQAKISSDLQSIVSRALEKSPDRRYQSAEALERDLQRFLAGDPVEARGAARGYLLRKALAKHRLLVAGVCVVFAILVASTFISLRFWKDALAKAAALEESKKETERERDVARRALRERLQLRDRLDVADLLEQEKGLWPVGPRLVDPCRRWLDAAYTLLRNQEVHSAAQAALRSRGDLATAGSDVYLYANAEDYWLDDQLASLLGQLEDLERAAASVAERMRRSATLEQRTVTQHAGKWEECLESLDRDPRFRGLNLAPVSGLVPLGRHPHSGFWTFWHVESGAHPPFDDEHRCWRPDDASGLILVLLPGGGFSMGAERGVLDEESERPNVDPAAEDDCVPVDRVTLAPFFLSQYELTIGQWRRFTGSVPSANPLGSGTGRRRVTASFPVDNVSWLDASRVVRSLGLTLPTEAQWEYAARGDTTTVFFSGDTVATLRGYANIYDAGSWREQAAGRQVVPTPDFDDGFIELAPVGFFRPNLFGIFDMVGNVSEWCRDAYGRYSVRARPGDGLREPPGGDNRRVHRGGSCHLIAELGSSALRQHTSQDVNRPMIGVRPALPLPSSH